MRTAAFHKWGVIVVLSFSIISVDGKRCWFAFCWHLREKVSKFTVNKMAQIQYFFLSVLAVYIVTCYIIHPLQNVQLLQAVNLWWNRRLPCWGAGCFALFFCSANFIIYVLPTPSFFWLTHVLSRLSSVHTPFSHPIFNVKAIFLCGGGMHMWKRK